MVVSKNPLHIIVPTLQCNARCSYCFMPHNSSVMSEAIFNSVLDSINCSVEENNSSITDIQFHGGEPLMIGESFWKFALQRIDYVFNQSYTNLTLQSNLWLFNKTYAHLFIKHNVKIGTSLDGPKEITDSQRGSGYFEKTMNGIRIAQDAGLSLGCIATLNSDNIHLWPKVFDFFLCNNINFAIHVAQPGYSGQLKNKSVSPKLYSEFIIEMIEDYKKINKRIQIYSLDNLCQSFYYGIGQVCTFQDCLGSFLCYGPNGDIYPCHRFCGTKQYKLGNVNDGKVGDKLFNGEVGRYIQSVVQKAHIHCQIEKCTHFNHCRSGCIYNILSSDEGTKCDPYCDGYKKAFEHINKSLINDIDSKENLKMISDSSPKHGENPLYRRGTMIDLAKAKPHPELLTRTYQYIITSVEIARAGVNSEIAIKRLLDSNVVKSNEEAVNLIKNFKEHFLTNNVKKPSNVYFHITDSCLNHCQYCYMDAGVQNSNSCHVSTTQFSNFLIDAKKLGIKMVVITGGEPLKHNEIDNILSIMQDYKIKSSLRPKLFLSTSLSFSLNNVQLMNMANSCDRIGISIDGPENIHNKRRGSGSYQMILKNLGELLNYTSHIQLYCTIGLENSEIDKQCIEHVNMLSDRLNLLNPQILPVLQIGRAKQFHSNPISKNLPLFKSSEEIIQDGFSPKFHCLGTQLHIDPDGACYPCYACHWPDALIGKISDGLANIIYKSNILTSTYNVDNNPICSKCMWRYLCGGACQAWQKNEPKSTVNSAPLDCTIIKNKANELYETALNKLRSIS
jgi:uncharacterized protein